MPVSYQEKISPQINHETMKALFVLLNAICLAGIAQSQLYVQHGSALHLSNGSQLYIQGNVESFGTLTGTGSVFLTGTTTQLVRGVSVTDLIVDNEAGVSLTGDISVMHALHLLKGNLLLNDNNLQLSESASIQNTGNNGIETNATGAVYKKINANQQAFVVPLVSAGSYTSLRLTTAGTYQQAFIKVSSKAAASPNKPLTANDYLNHFWTIERSGINGTVEALVSYSNNTKITGEASALQGFYWNKKQWIATDNSFSATQRTIRATITGNGGEMAAMSAQNINPFYIRPFTLTPNPARSFARLNFSAVQSGRALISVSDAQGRIVRTQIIELNKGPNQYNVNVQGLTNGYYDVTIYHSGKQTSLKLIKN
jgi:hypothetical protein